MAHFNVKSNLAKLLATENIAVQHDPSIHTAAFDLKNRVLMLPVWENISDDLYDMLVVHEVGHALDTPTDGWENAINDISKRINANAANIKTFLNVVEDVRIDKRQKRRYPGSRKNYSIGYRELLERDFLGIKGRALHTFSLIDRLNIYYKGGSLIGVPFTNEERAFLEEANETETFEEVIDLTERLYIYCKENDTKQSNQPQPSEEDDESEEGSGYIMSSDDADDTEEADINMDMEDFDGMSDDADDGDEEDSDENGNLNNNAEPKEQEPVSETEKTWEEKQQDIVKTENRVYNYVDMPTFNYETTVDDYPVVIKEQDEFLRKHYDTSWIAAIEKEFSEFKKNENNTLSFLVKEFEQRKAADQYARTSVAKTGVIDTNKLFKFKYSDDLFLRQAVVRDGKNHGFVMFLDWSGSMHPNLGKTVRQLISLTMFCKRVQIPFEVYAFRSRNFESRNNGFSFSRNPNELKLEDFTLRNLLSSRMKLADYNLALRNLWAASKVMLWTDPMNSTPLNEAIIAARTIVREFQAKNKVQIVSTIFLTDGGADIISRPSYARPANPYTKVTHILRDKETAQTYVLDTYEGEQTTNTLLGILKNSTKCNLVGFYIFDGSANYMMSKFFSTNPENEQKELRKDYRELGFVPVKNAGYDQYFVLNPATFDIKTTGLKVDGDMTKAKIAKEFANFANKKKVNRVLLKKFIDQIVE